MDSAVLEVEGISKHFGGVTAVRGVSFDVVKGQILGLIGPNGAGKTTIFNMISGIYRTDDGIIRLEGQDITNARTSRVSRLGIARTFQVPRTFNDMTVEENLLVSAVRARTQWQRARTRVNEILASIGMTERRHQHAAELSGGERQLLQFARATVTTPKLMILDEPFAGSSPDIVDLMLDRIRALADSGVAVLVISHDIVSLPRLCEEVIVLVDGAVLTRGRFERVREDLQVIEAYLGA